MNLKPSILDRYLLSEFLKIFVYTLFFIIIVNHLIEIVERLNFFISNRIKFFQIILYYFLKSPYIAIQLAPVAALFAVVFTLGIFVKNREMIAVIVSGVSFYRVVFYLYLTGFFLSIFFIFFNDIVGVPFQQKVSDLTNKFKNIYHRKDRSSFSMYGKNNILYYVQYYNSQAQMLLKVQVIQMSEDKSKVVSRIDAENATWDKIKKIWIFRNGIIRKFNLDGECISTEFFDEKEIDLLEKPEDFEYVKTNIDEMRIKEAWNYIKSLKAKGFEYNKELVEFHLKFSFPFACFIMMIIGAPLSLYSTKSVIVLSLGFALMGSFLYWVILSIGVSLGKNGLLPAFVSVWIGNFIFLVISFFIHKIIKT